MEQSPPEEPPTTKKTWWQKHKEDILIWTSIGSFVIALFHFVISVAKYLKK